jgi:hypothetical protein
LGGGGIYKKRPYYTECMWRDGRCMVVGDKTFGLVSYVIVGGSGVCISPSPGLHFVRFLKQIFGYTAFKLYCR